MTTVADQLVWCLAREVAPDDVLVVGVATPVAHAAALLARELLHPGLTVVVAASVDPATHDIAPGMLDDGYVSRVAAGTLGQADVLDAIQRGRVTLQFVSPAQVDGTGRLNTSRVRGPDGAVRRLPGGLATGDVAVLVGRLVAYRARHEPRFLAAETAFSTGAGHERGDAWRRRRGLTGRGVQTIVTDRAVLRWDAGRGGFALASVHAGVSVDEAVAGCGFPLAVPREVPVTEPPSAAARRLLDEVIDPLGVRRLEVPAERGDARAALERLERRMAGGG